MTDAELAWLAGLLEGEGCFYLTTRYNKDGSPRPLLSVICSMTDEDVINRLHTLVASGSVHVRYPKLPNRKVSWTFNDSNVDTVVPLITRLQPLMGARRAAKIAEMLDAASGWKRRPVADHGTRSRYQKGCRCAVCKKANATAHRHYLARRKEVMT